MRNVFLRAACRNGLVFVAVILIAGSCLERREQIVIHPDGSVDVIWKAAGHESDAKSGLGLPVGNPWQIRRWFEKQKDGEQRFHYEAKATFASIDRLSTAFEFSPSDLKIENSLEIKKARGKTFYVFKRVYKGRDWWRFQRIKDKALDKELLERVAKKSFQNLPSSDQEKLVAGLLEFEVNKRVLIVSEGLGRAMIGSGFPVQLISKCLRELEMAYRGSLTSARIRRLLTTQGEVQKTELEKTKSALAAAEQSVLSENFKDRPTVNIEQSVASAKADFDLTEDLSDESFQLSLAMPGTIIVTNGEQKGAGSVFWEFKGEDLMNRDIPITAVSVVE